MKYYTEIPYTLKNLDNYYARKSIQKELKLQAKKFSGVFLDIGCGYMPYKSMITSSGNVKKYLGMDLESNKFSEQIRPDITWDGITIPLDSESVDSAMATEVLEHCPEPGVVLKEVTRVLKPNGVFFITVPFLWPLHDVPNDEYRYTPFALNRLFTKAGFENIQVKALGGWNASLAQMLGLWVRRAPMPKIIRYILMLLFYPMIYVLITFDSKPRDFNKGRNMFTSLSVVAEKKDL